MAASSPRRKLPLIGWREWVALSELGGIVVKAKVDTGARTSALHATQIERVVRDGQPWVQFLVHPDHDDPERTLPTEAPLVDRRSIRSSSGDEEQRFVIRVVAGIHGVEHPIEVTLTERGDMGFRMLLGRRAIRRHYLVDPSRSYLSKEPAPPPGHERHRRRPVRSD